MRGRASWRVPFEAIVRPVKSNNDSIQTGPRFSRRALAKSPGLCWAFHKQKSESLAALMLAHNLLRGRFLDASGGLGRSPDKVSEPPAGHRTATASGTAPATSAAGRGGICLSLPAPHRLRLRGHREDGVLRHELAESSEVPHTSYFDSSACAICAVSATCWKRTMRPSRIVQTCAKRALKVLPVVIARAVYVPRAKTRRVSSFSIA